MDGCLTSGGKNAYSGQIYMFMHVGYTRILICTGLALTSPAFDFAADKSLDFKQLQRWDLYLYTALDSTSQALDFTSAALDF